jgi:hypothetical protein
MTVSTRIASPIAKIQLGLIASNFEEFEESLATAKPISFEELGEIKQQYDRLRSNALYKVKQCVVDQSLTEQFESKLRVAVSPEATRRREVAEMHNATPVPQNGCAMCATFLISPAAAKPSDCII